MDDTWSTARRISQISQFEGGNSFSQSIFISYYQEEELSIQGVESRAFAAPEITSETHRKAEEVITVSYAITTRGLLVGAYLRLFGP